MEGRLRSAEAAMVRLDQLTTPDNSLAVPEMVEWLRTQYRHRIHRISACCVAMDRGSFDRLAAFRHLQHEVIAAERKTAIRLRNQGVLNLTSLKVT